MSVSLQEIPPDAERKGLIESVTNDAATYLQIDRAESSPTEIVKIIDEVVVRIVFGEAVPLPEEEESDLLLGCLWGEQMVREFGWSWADIRSGEALDIAVLSAERDMVIYPFTFVSDCIRKRCVCTVELSFNMLMKRKGERIYPPKSYESIMTHIRHIVPPYTLELKS